MLSVKWGSRDHTIGEVKGMGKEGRERRKKKKKDRIQINFKFVKSYKPDKRNKHRTLKVN